MKFYLIECKHGHVGRDKYLPLVIPVHADSVDQAIGIAKLKPGVKKDHKDWCLKKPLEVDAATYEKAKEAYFGHRYFKKRTRQNLDLFKGELVKEPNYTIRDKIKTNTKTYFKKKDLSKFKAKRIKELNQSFRKKLLVDDFET
jgi:hypothetical protein